MSDDEDSEDAVITRLEQLRITRRDIADEEERLLRTLRLRREAQRPSATGTAGGVAHTNFQVGDHVYITNNITHVRILRRSTPADRAAVIQNISNSGRIYFTTYSGVRTWRSRDHVRHLSPSEQIRIRERYVTAPWR